MATKKKPSDADLARGGFNPASAKPSHPKEQFGPLPTDDPDAAKSREDRGKRSSKRS